MITVEGLVLAGLDEFMLRTGHLLTLCRIGLETGPSWRRISTDLANTLSLDVLVPSEANEEVADYLAEKKLCANLASKTLSKPDKLRYPDLEVVRKDSGELEVRSKKHAQAVRVSWQDRNFADRRVRSRVGAITSSAKTGSKTGLSHIVDWAQILELAFGTGQLSAPARLMATITGGSATPYANWNPYLPGNERIFIAYEFFRRDLDIFSRLAPKILRSTTHLTKSDCQELFVEALQEASKEAENSRLVSQRQRFELHKQVRDLERSAKRADKKIEEISTAWHRVSSRLETLTDFGLLEKGGGTEKEKYQYVYRATDRLALAVETLERASSAEDWLLNSLAEVVIGDPSLAPSNVDAALLADLAKIVRALSLPTTLLPIYCLALGLVYLHVSRGQALSLAEARLALERLPSAEPDIARLARGREGTRAEFISINLRKIHTA